MNSLFDCALRALATADMSPAANGVRFVMGAVIGWALVALGIV